MKKSSGLWPKVLVLFLLIVILGILIYVYLNKQEQKKSTPAAKANTTQNNISLSSPSESSTPVPENAIKGTVQDAALKEPIEGAILVAASGKDQLPKMDNIQYPNQFISSVGISSSNYVTQKGDSGFAFTLPDDAKFIRVGAPCYISKDIKKEDLKNGVVINLNRSCKENLVFGQVLDTVTSKPVNTPISYSTSSDNNAVAIETDVNGFFTKKIDNDKRIGFALQVKLANYRNSGFQASIDPTQPASNTWRDINLMPDIQGAPL